MSRIVKLMIVTVGGALAVLAILQVSKLNGSSQLAETKASNFYGEVEPWVSSQVTRNGADLRQVQIKDESAAYVDTATMCSKAPYIILGQPMSNSISLRLLSDYASNVMIELIGEGSTATQTAGPFELVASQPSAMLDVPNLKMSTRYAYRVLYQNGPQCEGFFSTESYYFHTQRYFGEQFTFAVTADTHFNDPGVYDESVFSQTRTNIMNAVQSAAGYDFVVDLGDTFMGDKLNPKAGTEYKLYENAFKEMSLIARSAPVFLVNGNHDGESGEFRPKAEEGATPEQIDASPPMVYARLRNKYFSNPLSGGIYSSNPDTSFPTVGQLTNYYAWIWGNAFNAVLDPYWYTPTHISKSPWQWTLGEGQYNWLHGVLQTPAGLKFIYIHHYVGGVFGTSAGFRGGGDETFAKYFEWGGLDHITGQDAFAMNRPGWNYGSIHQMMVRNQVSVVFRGHDHLYYVGELDGIIYNTLPRTSEGIHKSTSLKERWTEKGYKTGDAEPTSGHAEIAVTNQGAVVTLLSSSTNTPVHTYSVAAKPATA